MRFAADALKSRPAIVPPLSICACVCLCVAVCSAEEIKTAFGVTLGEPFATAVSTSSEKIGAAIVHRIKPTKMVAPFQEYRVWVTTNNLVAAIRADAEFEDSIAAFISLDDVREALAEKYGVTTTNRIEKIAYIWKAKERTIHLSLLGTEKPKLIVEYSDDALVETIYAAPPRKNPIDKSGL